MAKKKKVAKKKKKVTKKKAAKKKKATGKKKKAAVKRVKKGIWSAADLKLLKKLFSNTLTVKVAAMLGRPYDAVKKKAARMGLSKAKSYMKKLGRG